MQTKLIWITPDAEKLLAYIARVSNPSGQGKKEVAGLLEYMVKHAHWSPFEMASAAFEINTTRDIARQILRHRSFSFQEFSQRYSSVVDLPDAELRECRLQDRRNRQSSLEADEPELEAWWYGVQSDLINATLKVYSEALETGVAKEVARSVLLEGLTPTRMYMSGTIRSWMHYCKLRTGPETQKEHRAVAESISKTLESHLPTVWSVFSEHLPNK